MPQLYSSFKHNSLGLPCFAIYQELVYVLITPGSAGDQWKFISPEVIGSALFFLGLFILVVFNALTKVPLNIKGNPFLKESEHFHY